MNGPDGDVDGIDVPVDSVAGPGVDPGIGPGTGGGGGAASDTDAFAPAAGSAVPPGARLTSRSIRTFVIRNGRLTGAQHEALGRLLPRYGIEHSAAVRALPEAGVAAFFPRPGRPLRVEVGFGNGDALLGMAAAEPGVNHLGIEVHAPGVGHALLGLEALEREGRGLDNVRLCRHDAIEVLDALCRPGSVERVYVFFPDPWTKKRHHKRRILRDDFLAAAARALAPGGLLHAATDVVEYADWMLERLTSDARFENRAGRVASAPATGHAADGATDGATDTATGNAAADVGTVVPEGFAPRPAWRPGTRFERRGERLGHEVRDLVFARRSPAGT